MQLPEIQGVMNEMKEKMIKMDLIKEDIDVAVSHVGVVDT